MRSLSTILSAVIGLLTVPVYAAVRTALGRDVQLTTSDITANPESLDNLGNFVDFEKSKPFDGEGSMRAHIFFFAGILLSGSVYSAIIHVPGDQPTIQAGTRAIDLPANHHGQEALVMRNISSMPLAFTENQGQWNEKVLFRADAGGATMWFTDDGAYYQFTRKIPGDYAQDDIADPMLYHPDDRVDSIETMMIKASFVGANVSPHVVGEDMLAYKCNYFIGNDPDRWRTNVPSYRTIVFEEVYSGIDLKYYGNGRQMEYDFIVSPGADPSQILVQYDGAKSLSVNDAGELVVETDWGSVTELALLVYQMDGDELRPVRGEYTLISDSTFGFQLPHGYDSELALVIDPVLDHSTYLGGSGNDAAWGIAVDNQGCIYVTGETYSLDFPIENEYQTAQGLPDAFVTKLNSSGDSLIFSTYLGGNGYLDDAGCDIALGTDGSIYLTGYTESADFPVKNPFQTYQGGYDAFVTELGSSGDSLVFSTYLGGTYSDATYGIAIDGEGNAFVSGETNSTNFPTRNPYQLDQGGWDVFVTKLAASGDSLIYSTYLGGSGTESDWFDIAIDVEGNAYVTGMTQSSDFPIKNQYQLDQGGNDVFVTKLGVSGDSLVYSTYLGGSSGDYGYAITIDDSGQVFVTGWTYSTDFPTANPYLTYQGDADAFVTKLSGSGDSLIYSTYLGGGGGEVGWAITIDSDDQAFITGGTQSSDFPTENPLQTYHGHGTDAFVAALNSSGDSLIFGTYLSGNDFDGAYDVAVNASGDICVTGNTYSSDFPIENPYQVDQPGQDAFVTMIADVVTDVTEHDRPALPEDYMLCQNYPNPFNPATVIDYSVSRRCVVTISVYNILGQEINTIVDEEKAAGTYTVQWNGTDYNGEAVATGVYFYRLEAADYLATRKMILVK